jgi:hypothetical protein
MDHVGDCIPDRTRNQQREQRLFGCLAAHIFGSLRALRISLCRCVADLLAGLDRCVPDRATAWTAAVWAFPAKSLAFSTALVMLAFRFFAASLI